MPLGLNKADLSVARAPLATHYALTANDGCFPLQVWTHGCSEGANREAHHLVGGGAHHAVDHLRPDLPLVAQLERVLLPPHGRLDPPPALAHRQRGHVLAVEPHRVEHL